MKSNLSISNIIDLDNRTTTPVETIAKAVLGIIKCLRRSIKSPPPYKEYMPDAGKSFNSTVKSKIIIIPKKKEGIDIPNITEKVIILSKKLY